MSQPPLNDNKPPLDRRRNAGRPLDAATNASGAHEEPRNFDTDAPPGGHMGSGGDPSEGKRD